MLFQLVSSLIFAKAEGHTSDKYKKKAGDDNEPFSVCEADIFYECLFGWFVLRGF